MIPFLRRTSYYLLLQIYSKDVPLLSNENTQKFIVMALRNPLSQIQ